MKYGVATSNCTSALHLSLLALNIKKNDEIICPALTFIAPANMILASGAKLVLVDVCPDTYSIDINLLKKKINHRTKAILVVHPFGHAADMEKIISISKEYNLRIIEDVAEAIGGKYKNKLLGTFGDLSCFSFFGNKVITSGEGGMILTNNKKFYNSLRIYRDHGMSLNKKYLFVQMGFNYRMTGMQASIGLSQLSRLHSILKKKSYQEKIYRKFLFKVINKNIFFRKNAPWSKSVNWLVTISLKNQNLRNKLINFLKKNSIESRPMIYPVNHALHLRNKFDKNTFRVSKNISLKSLHLPSSLKLTINEIQYICSKINLFFKKK